MALLQNYKVLYEQGIKIDHIIRNGQIVWPSVSAPSPVYSEPFYVENITNENETVKILKIEAASPTISIEKSNDAVYWETAGSTSTAGITLSLTPNQRIYLRAKTNSWSQSQEELPFYNRIIGCSKIGGNIMSLLYGNEFTGLETSFPGNYTRQFMGLFSSNTNLIDASDLLLPVTNLTPYCYLILFGACTSLNMLPVLPATTLAEGCYASMFAQCRALTAAPVLPATTLAEGCYTGMFNTCRSLVNAPVLPATTLADYCYYQMFDYCTSLTTAPELPATTLTNNCYQYMFRDCTSLNYVKCLATSGINTNNSTNDWLWGVRSGGTFVKAAGVSWPTGTSGIPSGWTIIEVQ